MQERRDAGKQGRKYRGMQERRYSRDEGCKFGSHMAQSSKFKVAVLFSFACKMFCLAKYETYETEF